ncbi:Ribosomal protein L13, bacterial-type [Candidatus Omnitrophus magneticus]|uniref:Large ribosomal subunit protein uL13 n=1 Tax=Candidatus Omnitrophus magneticus TaxID=1609969 RepID=A0A0F0CU43_9BACT|nr:Ribosomal protein L13, bacterial-type [Candidatus Omnitrophus magneticus]
MGNNITVMKNKKNVVHDWYLIDAEGKTLGRLATKIAALIRGKHLVDYSPHVDMGAGVIVINCGKVKVTGNKLNDKIYTTYSGYPSGLKETSMKKILDRKPKYILRHAVRGMLGQNRLTVLRLRRLKLYEDAQHPHVAQSPKKIDV